MPILLLFLLTGCAPIATLSLSSEVDLEVHRAVADQEMFSVKVKFLNKTNHPEVIQEAHAELGYVFVEKFEAANGSSYTDNHYNSGLQGQLVRKMRVYAGRTAGTDDTWAGFAMLPKNMDGTVVTVVDKTFNAAYQSEHQIRGEVVAQSAVTGEWEIHWKPGYVEVVTKSGRVIRDAEGVRVVR